MNFDKNKTRVYIAGCGGMLGLAVYEVFDRVAIVKATDIDLNEEWLDYADVRDYENIRESVISFSPDFLINLAAITDMEECETNQTDAWLTNSLGTEHMALLANELNIPLIYISTAGIFGGEKDEFNDFDTPNPLSVYAKSKFAGEVFVREHVRSYYVVRAGWMMGGGPRKDKKFINKIYRQVTNGARILRVVDDKLGTPTYTHDFAAGLLALARSNLYGVYNQVCRGASSRYDVAQEFIRLLNLVALVKVIRVKSDFFGREYFAPRPQSEMLLNMKLNARNLNSMRDWRSALAAYAIEFQKDYDNCSSRVPLKSSADVFPVKRPIIIRLVAEAATPHNNYLFSRIASNPAVALEANYVYKPDGVPGRPWKNLNITSENIKKTRLGISSFFHWGLITETLRDKRDVNFIIGWNTPLFIFLLTVIGLRKLPLLTWFDTPKVWNRNRWHPKSLIKRWAIQMINRAPGTVFVTGRLAQAEMQSLGIVSEKIRILPFFVPDPVHGMEVPDERDLFQRIGVDQNCGVLIVAAGRMIESKGFDLLLSALAQAAGQFVNNWHALIVGAGPELENLKKQLQSLALDDRVKFSPWLEAEEFARVFSVADIFVAPARFDPFPTTIISAMRAGTAIVATDGVGSAVELLTSGENGIIVPRESPEDLSRALVSLVNSTEIRDSLGRNAMDSIARWPVEQGVCEVLDAAERAVEAAI